MGVATAICVWAAFAASWAFLGLYGLLAPWWKSPMGRHLFSFGAMVAGLLTLVLATGLLGHGYTGHTYVRLAAYAVLAVVLWRHVAMAARSQLKRHRDRTEK